MNDLDEIAQKVGMRRIDRKSTRLNSSHSQISYAVFCLKKKKQTHSTPTHKDTPAAYTGTSARPESPPHSPEVTRPSVTPRHSPRFLPRWAHRHASRWPD